MKGTHRLGHRLQGTRAPDAGGGLGQVLRRLRSAAGLTQEELAERSAISARSVSDLERGVRTAVYPHTARRLAAALGFLGLAAMDRVQVGSFDGAHLPALRGRDGVARVWRFIEELEPGGQASAEHLAGLRWPRPGLTVGISDFLVEDADWAPARAGLRRRRQEPVLWQVLAPEEEDPELKGDLKLIDAESGRARELTITAGLLREYRAALAGHRERLARAGRAAGGRFLHSRSSDDLEATLLAGLRAGVVRRG